MNQYFRISRKFRKNPCGDTLVPVLCPYTCCIAIVFLHDKYLTDFHLNPLTIFFCRPPINTNSNTTHMEVQRFVTTVAHCSMALFTKGSNAMVSASCCLCIHQGLKRDDKRLVLSMFSSRAQMRWLVLAVVYVFTKGSSAISASCCLFTHRGLKCNKC